MYVKMFYIVKVPLTHSSPTSTLWELMVRPEFSRMQHTNTNFYFQLQFKYY